MDDEDLEMKRMLYPTVTEILGKQTERQMRAIPIETLANACIRGVQCHAYSEAYLKNLYTWEYEEEYKPYMDAFIEWADKNVEHLIFSESRLYDDEMRFSGKPDFIVKLKDSKQTALVDPKFTSQTSLSWAVQLAAYEHLCVLNGYNVDRIFNLHIKQIKRAQYEIIDNERIMISPAVVKVKQIEKKDLKPYFRIFTSSLDCYRYFEKLEVANDEL